MDCGGPEMSERTERFLHQTATEKVAQLKGREMILGTSNLAPTRQTGAFATRAPDDSTAPESKRQSEVTFQCDRLESGVTLMEENINRMEAMLSSVLIPRASIPEGQSPYEVQSTTALASILEGQTARLVMLNARMMELFVRMEL
jgi:hypothetical protein